MNLIKTLTGLMTRLEKMNERLILAINKLAKAINRVADISERDDEKD